MVGRVSVELGTGANVHFESLYRQHITMVRASARRLLGHGQAAEDVAQEVFLQFFQHHPTPERLRSVGNVAGYLFRSTNHMCLNRIRDERRRSGLLETRVAPTEAQREPLSEELRVAITQVLDLVDDELAQIATHHFVHGLDQDEIADVMNLNRRTVGRRLERFREEARALLRSAENEVPLVS